MTGPRSDPKRVFAADGHGRPDFPSAARTALSDAQLRENLGRATGAIREKRQRVVSEVPDWAGLTRAARGIKEDALRRLPELLLQLEASVLCSGGTVHWARDASEANRIICGLVEHAGAREVVKVKSITTDEVGLNDALSEGGIAAVETDLAELIIQLASETSSHFLVPAIHKNRVQIRDLFREHLGRPDLSDDPSALAEAARVYLRGKFLTAEVAVSGANFACADTGTVVVVESEGNGRMCLTLPRVLITLMGIEKVLPSFRDLEVFLQLLPRSATGERMNPYTTLWQGVHPGDGPEEFHLVLLDNGRSRVLADEVGRQALHCIRCSACLNICPVYSRVGGHAYHATYPGPIGSILTPQLLGPLAHDSLPFASTLCGACREVCPVGIDIPKVLLHLRARVVEGGAGAGPGVRPVTGPRGMSGRSRVARFQERAFMGLLAVAFRTGFVYRWGSRLARAVVRRWGRGGWICRLPGYAGGWTMGRDLPVPAPRSFQDLWASGSVSHGGGDAGESEDMP